MGRFYKPAEYTPVDNIYKLPAEAMMKAIANTDAMVDSGIEQNDLFEGALGKINSLSIDSERVKQIRDGYNSKIKESSQSLMNDPTNYRKYLPSIKQLGKELQTDMSSGEIAAIQSRVQALNDWDKVYKPLVGAKDGITPEAYTAMRNSFIKNICCNNNTHTSVFKTLDCFFSFFEIFTSQYH